MQREGQKGGESVGGVGRDQEREHAIAVSREAGGSVCQKQSRFSPFVVARQHEVQAPVEVVLLHGEQRQRVVAVM